MDLNQRKLIKSEWENIEIPVSQKERNILQLIISGYYNPNIKTNPTLSIESYLKINHSKKVDDYIYYNYIQTALQNLCKKYFNDIKVTVYKNSEKHIKKAEIIRMNNMSENLEKCKDELIEFIILKLLKQMFKDFKENKMWIKSWYAIVTLMNYDIKHFNETFKQTIISIIEHFKKKIQLSHIIYNARDYIEKNPILLKYADNELYDHQKQLFTICKNKNPKLILYIAPTGTGKTMSPLGLSENHKIIFVCAARHVGLALARAAISVDKKIAFAFGCSHAEDIRLHYFAAKDFTKDWKTGGIRKVDNSAGDNVEIMICDIQSYISAMYYMASFNKKEDIITYWDEPTITMDYDEHPFHELIHKNWTENIIPNMVLSSATLPHQDEIIESIMNFKSRFNNSEVYNITSFDCKKTIPLVNKECYIEMPHYMEEQYTNVKKMIKHCNKYKTLLRYLDLYECTRFIHYINSQKDLLSNENYYIDNYFCSLEEIHMNNIKLYYLKLLANIKTEKWTQIYKYFQQKRQTIYSSNIHITTKDAYTLTDGPTIYMANDIEKIAKLCLHLSNIPDTITKKVIAAIDFNNNINKKIVGMEKTLEDSFSKNQENEKNNDVKFTKEMRILSERIEYLRSQIKTVSLDDIYIPNTKHHLKKWAPELYNHLENKPFSSCINDETIEEIMLIPDIEDSWKLLLMMGIGVFVSHKSLKYIEIMKRLAYNQQLYLIIASTDYIYGTNYQFCHGYLSKDLADLTQEKCIQAMGRIGRNNIQQNYSLRFRDNNLIKQLFIEASYKPEVINMNKLFNQSE